MATFSRGPDHLAPYPNGQWFVVNLKPMGARIFLFENRDRLIVQRTLRMKVSLEAGLKNSVPPFTGHEIDCASHLGDPFDLLNAHSVTERRRSSFLSCLHTRRKGRSTSFERVVQVNLAVRKPRARVESRLPQTSAWEMLTVRSGPNR